MARAVSGNADATAVKSSREKELHCETKLAKAAVVQMLDTLNTATVGQKNIEDGVR